MYMMIRWTQRKCRIYTCRVTMQHIIIRCPKATAVC